jgi:GNAT superfamily N-acetyltransferase
MTQPPVTRATPASRDRVVDTVVTAFVYDPAFRFFFPDSASFVDRATTFARHLFDKRVGRGTIWIIDGGTSVAMWDEPADVAHEPRDDDDLALRLPTDCLARLTTYHAAVHSALPSGKFWYLGILATHPDGRGRRWGRMVMTPALDLAAEAGIAAYLETTNPKNIDLYRAAGWEIAATLRLDSLAIWVMNWVAKQPQGSHLMPTVTAPAATST